MHWKEAIEESPKGTATKVTNQDNGYRKTIIRYKDGSGYCLYAKNGKVDYFLSRPATSFELTDDGWEPSE